MRHCLRRSEDKFSLTESLHWFSKSCMFYILRAKCNLSLNSKAEDLAGQSV